MNKQNNNNSAQLVLIAIAAASILVGCGTEGHEENVVDIHAQPGMIARCFSESLPDLQSSFWATGDRRDGCPSTRALYARRGRLLCTTKWSTRSLRRPGERAQNVLKSAVNPAPELRLH